MRTIIFILLLLPTLSFAKSVLVLNSFHQGIRWSEEGLITIYQDMYKRYPGINWKTEVMNVAPAIDDKTLQQYVSLYKHKIGNQKFDLILCNGLPATMIARKIFPPTVPIVAIGGFKEIFEKIPNIYGEFTFFDNSKIVETIKRLHPDLGKIFLIADERRIGRLYRGLFKDIPEVVMTTSESLPEVMGYLKKNATSKDVLLMSFFNEDLKGNYYSEFAAMDALSSMNIPIYHIAEYGVELGAIGGYVVSPVAFAHKVSETISAILDGKSIAKELRVHNLGFYLFNEQLLHKYHINLKLLPPNSVMVHRPPSLFQTHKALLMLVGCILVFLMALSAGITVLYIRKKKWTKLLEEKDTKFRLAQQIADVGYFECFPESDKFWGCEKTFDLLEIGTGPGFYKWRNLTNAMSSVEKIISGFKKLYTESEPIDVELIYIKPLSKKSITLHLRAERIKNSNSILGIIQDITVRKEIERELLYAKNNAESANHLRSLFLNSIAQEIRTPMNAILGFSRLLSHEQVSTEMQGHIAIIQSSGRHLLDLMSSVLDLARLEIGTLSLSSVAIIPKDIFNDVITLTRPKIAANVVIEEMYDSSVEQKFLGDTAKIRQVILNILDNSAKFSKHGKITINAHVSNNILHVIITDSGIGMSKEFVDRIFWPFTQEHPGHGVGLGMTIVQKLLKLLNGTIVIQSSTGVGTEVTVAIPLEEFIEERNVVSNKSIDPNPRIEKILVAEDEETNQMLISLILKKMNLKFDLVNNGIAVLEQFEKEKYSLILMDLQMPKLDGLSAAKKIRTMDQDIPIIALTAHAMEIHQTMALEAGMTDYLAKPFDINHLERLICKYLGK